MMNPELAGRASYAFSFSPSGGWGRTRGTRVPPPGALLRVERWDSREDGPLTEAALRRKCEFEGCHVTRRTYHPGAVLAAQSVSRDRVEAIISGLLRITIDGQSAILAAGDAVFVPRGSVRRIEVVGSMPVVSLEAVIGEPTPSEG
ncbi:MAG: cupin domain-containing protein [Vicinamibacterales bacterium]